MSYYLLYEHTHTTTMSKSIRWCFSLGVGCYVYYYYVACTILDRTHRITRQLLSESFWGDMAKSTTWHRYFPFICHDKGFGDGIPLRHNEITRETFIFDLEVMDTQATRRVWKHSFCGLRNAHYVITSEKGRPFRMGTNKHLFSRELQCDWMVWKWGSFMLAMYS